MNIKERKLKSNILLKKYPNRVPVIVKKSTIKCNLNELKKKKYLIPNSMTLGELIVIIRKNIELSSSTALYIFVNNTMIPSSDILAKIYHEYKNEDGFLYLYYTGENTFG